MRPLIVSACVLACVAALQSPGGKGNVWGSHRLPATATKAAGMTDDVADAVASTTARRTRLLSKQRRPPTTGKSQRVVKAVPRKRSIDARSSRRFVSNKSALHHELQRHIRSSRSFSRGLKSPRAARDAVSAAVDAMHAGVLFDSVHDYTLAISALGAVGDLDRALALLSSMDRPPPPPTKTTGTTGTTGTTTAAARPAPRRRDAIRVVPDTIVYNTALAACARARRPREALALLRKMRAPRLAGADAAAGSDVAGGVGGAVPDLKASCLFFFLSPTQCVTSLVDR